MADAVPGPAITAGTESEILEKNNNEAGEQHSKDTKPRAPDETDCVNTATCSDSEKYTSEDVRGQSSLDAGVADVVVEDVTGQPSLDAGVAGAAVAGELEQLSLDRCTEEESVVDGQRVDEVDRLPSMSKILKRTIKTQFAPPRPSPSLADTMATSDQFEYKMNHKRRGRCIIINNRRFHADSGMNERKGTDLDADRLVKTFTSLGFTCIRGNNLTRTHMLSLVKNVSLKDHTDSDCVVLAVLSHGGKKVGDDKFSHEVVYGTDYYVTVEDLTDPLKGNNCPTLIGKPKFFIIQACRGDRTDPGVPRRASSTDIDTDGPPAPQKVPVESDCLFAFSTVSGYLSWRNQGTGSWFMQSLCDVFDAYAKTKEVMWLLTRVNREVANTYQSKVTSEKDKYLDGMKEMPSAVTQLTKLLYF